MADITATGPKVEDSLTSELPPLPTETDSHGELCWGRPEKEAILPRLLLALNPTQSDLNNHCMALDFTRLHSATAQLSCYVANFFAA